MLNWLNQMVSYILKMFKTQTPSSTDEVRSKSIDERDQTFDHSSNSSITFYPNLVEHLIVDHQHLLNIFKDIGEALDSQKYPSIIELLTQFKVNLSAHLNVENIKFYGYLEQSLKGQNTKFQAMRNFRKEMRTIERAVIKFLDQWITDGVNLDTAEKFKAEYSAIGSALMKRIGNEEKELYVLYSKI